MKKHLSYLITVVCFLSMLQAQANIATDMGGYNPGTYNTTQNLNTNFQKIDKSYVQSKEDARGKLKYSDSVADLMRTAGAKSYKLLRAILEEGEARDAKTSEEGTNTAAVEGGYEAGKANVNS